MSHFSRLKTIIKEKDLLLSALEDMGYTPEEGELKVGGFGFAQTPVEIRVKGKKLGYDIGFNQNREGNYVVVADWFGVRGVNQHEFVEQLNQRYAYHAARQKLEAQGFTLVAEEVQEEGRIHLVLRRTA